MLLDAHYVPGQTEPLCLLREFSPGLRVSRHSSRKIEKSCVIRELKKAAPPAHVIRYVSRSSFFLVHADYFLTEDVVPCGAIWCAV